MGKDREIVIMLLASILIFEVAILIFVAWMVSMMTGVR